MKKIISIVLMIALMAPFAACGSNEGGTDGDGRPAAENGAADPGAPVGRWARIDPGLPDADFGGYGFNIVSWHVAAWGDLGGGAYDIAAEELIGEAFNDAVFNRNKTIEDKYGININLIKMDMADINAKVRQMVAAGEDSYDLVYQRLYNAMALISSGMLHDLKEIPYLNFDMPWWDRRSVDDLSLAGRVFIGASDISTTIYDSIGCVLFNKQLAQEYALDNLYDVANRGEWTIDYMSEICRNKARDLDGDGIIDTGDFMPFVGHDLTLSILYIGAGNRFIAKNADDLPIDAFGDERTINACEKILEFVYDKEVFMNTDGYSNRPNFKHYIHMFEEDQSIFTVGQIFDVRRLRAKEIDFGILPAPKYDRNQNGYFSYISVHQSGLASVPITASDFDRTGIVLEALSAESRYTVLPAFYDISLKGKYARDEESAEMLDILFDSRVYELGAIGQFGGFEDTWLRIMNSGSRDIVSMHEKSENKIQADIDRLVKAIEENIP